MPDRTQVPAVPALLALLALSALAHSAKSCSDADDHWGHRWIQSSASQDHLLVLSHDRIFILDTNGLNPARVLTHADLGLENVADAHMAPSGDLLVSGGERSINRYSSDGRLLARYPIADGSSRVGKFAVDWARGILWARVDGHRRLVRASLHDGKAAPFGPDFDTFVRRVVFQPALNRVLVSTDKPFEIAAVDPDSGSVEHTLSDSAMRWPRYFDVAHDRVYVGARRRILVFDRNGHREQVIALPQSITDFAVLPNEDGFVATQAGRLLFVSADGRESNVFGGSGLASYATVAHRMRITGFHSFKFSILVSLGLLLAALGATSSTLR